MMRRPVERPRCHFRLKNRRNGLRFPWQAALDPEKLGRVESRHLHHGEMDPRTPMNQLATQRISEACNGMLGSTVCGLKWNTAIDQCRTDLDDRPTVPPTHPTQC